jgi:hypothetical protein
MKTGRHILRHDWKSLRADIENIIKDKDLSSTDFRQLSVHEDWKAIEENIYQTFCKLDHPAQRPIWLWERFKLATFSIRTKHPYTLLDKLIDNDEIVWFFVNGDNDKFWFYEGRIKAIMTIIGESTYIDELYLASKKYHWLVCINHHDYLIATGQIMPDKLRQLEITIQNSP